MHMTLFSITRGNPAKMVMQDNLGHRVPKVMLDEMAVPEYKDLRGHPVLLGREALLDQLDRLASRYTQIFATYIFTLLLECIVA